MSTKKISAGDTLTVGDLTDDHLGAVIEVGPTDGGITCRFRLDRIECYGTSQVKMLTTEGGAKHADLGERVTVITPPPVVQPDEPTVFGQCIRIEGDDNWRAVVVDPHDESWPILDMDGDVWHWDLVLGRAGDRQIIVSDPPRWPDETPEVPERPWGVERIEVGEWPDDDTHLREWEWIDSDGSTWCWYELGINGYEAGWAWRRRSRRHPKPTSGPFTRGERVE